MIKEETYSLNGLRLLVSVAADEGFVPTELAGRIKTLNALLEDLGKGMSEEMRRKWSDEASEVSSDCEENRHGLAAGMQELCIATMQALQARFYEVVQQDYVGAAGRYEEAADLMEQNQVPEVEKVLAKRLLEEGETSEERSSTNMDIMASFWRRFPEVDLWDAAGDAYCQVDEIEEKAKDARRCYEHALQILKLHPNTWLEYEVREARLCHISLSLANLLLAHFDEWEEAEALYREAADVAFFTRDEKDNKQYLDICWIIGHEDFFSIATSVDQFECAPHVYPPIAARHKESLTKLRAELGQKALDELKDEFNRSEEGFPVPETYYLVAILGELYLQLREYEKCANAVGEFGTDFRAEFFAFGYEQVDQLGNWAFPFVIYMEDASSARGRLQRPDYKEFMQQIEKMTDSHQRQELRLIRQEKMVREMGHRASLEETHNRLLQENPWLGRVVNPGSVVNAEAIYQQLSKQNWGEVVSGYCNAVEEELKPLYREYLAWRAGFDKGYVQESERQKKQGSVLYFIASMTRKDMKHQFWEQFVATRVPEHSEFLSNELPGKLARLVELRNPSTHGKMPERKTAEEARQIVLLGKADTPGVLRKLSSICPKEGNA